MIMANFTKENYALSILGYFIQREVDKIQLKFNNFTMETVWFQSFLNVLLFLFVILLQELLKTYHQTFHCEYFAVSFPLIKQNKVIPNNTKQIRD